jgi:hypothetical protein
MKVLNCRFRGEDKIQLDRVAAVYVSQEDDDGNNETTESVSDIIS